MFLGSWFFVRRFISVFSPAPATLGEGFRPSFLHDALTSTVVGLLRGDGGDARVVMLGVDVFPDGPPRSGQQRPLPSGARAI